MPIPSMIRTRWAAAGAALAVALGAGGTSLITATTPDGAAAFVAIAPCRLFDTRPDPQFNIGPRNAPLGPNDVHSVVGTGDVGECELPADVTGLALNVTAVDATRPTFLTLYPAGTDRPNASHLNPAPGTPPTPNAVTVDLGTDGTFSIFNRAGSVHVLADVVGYYTDHRHDDRYYTKAEVDRAIDGAAASRRQSLVIPAGASAHAYGAPDAGTRQNVLGAVEVTNGGLAMSIPLTIPAGSTIRAITYTYRDVNADHDIAFSVDEMSLPDGDPVAWAELAFTTSGAVQGFRSDTVDDLAFVIKPDHAYQFWAWRTGVDPWPAGGLSVRAITVEYDLPQ